MESELLTYDILENRAGQLLLAITAVDDEPQMPILFADGRSEAILFRRTSSALRLTHMPPEVCPKLMTVDRLLVVEMDGDMIRRSYEIPVRHSDVLPGQSA